jgi:hypothetical protein
VNGPNLDSDMPTELLEVTAGKKATTFNSATFNTALGAVLNGTQCGLGQQKFHENSIKKCKVDNVFN